ncbi:MAG: hypothetical protein WEA77_05030 [Hyphomonas sp.]|uniref:hypothetical protein n=1 Tax=Hyphomonas sp. TaxID=87 RepID=UPI0034A00724
MAAQTGSGVLVDALVRTPRTPSQAGLAGRAQRRSVFGPFKVRQSRLEPVRDRRVLRAGDVITAGKPHSARKRALKRAGARQVDVHVLARVVRETDATIY